MNERTKKKLPRWLCEAAAEGRVGKLKKTLKLGADPNTRYKGATPLYLASVQGEVRCAELLLQAGASPNIESQGWRSGLPLAAAAVHADLSMAELLLGYGADPNQKETGGATALDWARGWEEEVSAHAAVETLLADAASEK
ncbi:MULTISPECIES: ankyrin repeat domain-containing protein [Streptomyces]|uniref:Ankyrin repeat domain-containing protein n=1 Tax=Streptomyces koyangensis TaxID=188770 RepID=A0A385DLA7_9ACTN|nr:MULTISPECIES: ankyrin repeat domain-containing protein [Streptomyces]AXQ58740.1 ankyrin repeat domain-containing protein [Streptomyces koyangensis]PKR41325.1 serine/threonine protein kinase [Streptomyces sp. EAG2]WTD02959.1 ankyrin repeat domain-containing protein [Streptomyces albidoflavus]WTD07106.1 ankyrin repeat domain-containing protein [Streptomyces albidoflavus]